MRETCCLYFVNFISSITMSSDGGGDGNERRNNPPVAAIAYPEQGNVTVHPNQPRQPTNLPDLLRYSVEASGNESGSGQQRLLPMDEERKQWLEQSLKYLTVDVVEMLLQSVDVLKRAGTLELQDDPTECEEALERIAEYIDNLDTANDFHKIGGFIIFRPCLRSAHSSLRWRSAEIIAELSQNNPYCQERVLDAGLMPSLLSLIDTDSNEQVRIKALYAVSCMVRENPKVQKAFSEHHGYSILLRAMQSDIEKLQIKSAFLLSSLCSNNKCVKDELCQMGFIVQLVGMVTDYHQPALEHLLSALVAMVTDHHFSQDECRRPELHLRSTLRRLMKHLKGREEYRDEYDYAHQLLQLVFSGESHEDR